MKHKKEEIDEDTLTNFFNLLDKKEEKKYKQAWQAYDEAKTNEDIMFKRLLGELLFLAVPDDTAIRKGRKRYSKQDRIFCMVIKVYYKEDLRKTESTLKEMKNLGHIEKVPCYKSIDNFFNDPYLEELLDQLILITSLPMTAMEETGAIDSTGFSNSRYREWIKAMHNFVPGEEHEWRKLHAVVGCKTNTFISTKVTEANVHDSRMFESVVGDNVKLFNMVNFVADKAYLTKAIMEFIVSLGLVPYIPFKKNSVGRSRGSLVWSKAFKAFIIDHEKYMQKYHQRSNVESNFHMLKARFGTYCATKSLVANTNEIKVKVLCHNICVIIQELFENEINIDLADCVRKAGAVHN